MTFVLTFFNETDELFNYSLPSWIGSNFGLTTLDITEKLKINRKTIAYHLSKLEELDLIKVKKEGRKRKFYPTEDLDDLISEDL